MSNAGRSSSCGKSRKGKGTSKLGDAEQSRIIQVGYMHLGVIQFYYNELTKPFLYHAVDVLWANILPMYFAIEKGYGIEIQASPWPGVTKKNVNFAIRCVKNGQSKKVFPWQNDSQQTRTNTILIQPRRKVYVLIIADDVSANTASEDFRAHVLALWVD